MTETLTAPPPESTAPASPYKGLTHYTEEDASFFFGREAEIEIIVANLMASRLTLLYGESGVGKSSVLRAGVMRRLHEESARNLEERGEPEFLAIAFGDWRDDPVADLGEAIRRAAETLYGEPQEPVEPSPRLETTIAAWTDRIDGELVIVLDQFEEYFLYHPADEAPGTFAIEFPRALNRLDLRVSFLIGIREDALAKLDAFKGRIPNLFDNYLRIEHLNTKAARAAIEKPIAAYNRLRPEGSDEVAIEPKLVDAVLSQVRTGQFTFGQGGAGAVDGGAGPSARGDEVETPFLQLVMTRLWEEEMAAGSRTLRLRTLERLGGAERIVRTHLDHTMGALPYEQQDVAAEVFHHLVTPGGTKIAHTLSDLAEYAECTHEKLGPVLEKLSGSDVRILRPVAPPPGETGGLRYEIFHDVLGAAISDWRSRWVQTETERELAANLEEQERERKLAEEQAARERRRARTFRALALVAVLVAAVAALLGVWAFRQKDAAEKQRREARLQARSARSAELAARSSAERDLEPRLALALAWAAMRVKPTPQAEQALRVALSEARVRVMLRGHVNWVNTARYSPDGRYVLTAADDKTVRVWDARSGRPLTVLRAPSIVNMANWSADGRWIVGATSDGAPLWRWRGGANPPKLIRKPLRTLKTKETTIAAALGGPQGEYVLTSSFDDMVRIRERTSGKLLWQKEVDDLKTATFDATGERVLTVSELGDYQGRIFEWKRFPRRPPVLVNRPDEDGDHDQSDALNAGAFSPDGKMVITSSDDKSVAVWNAKTGDLLDQLYGPRDAALGVAMSPNQKFVAGASSDGTIYLWDWVAENRIATVRGHTDIVSDVSFSPDGRTLASASGDRTARLWAVPSVVPLSHKARVLRAAWSPDGKEILTASAQYDDESDSWLARIWDARTGAVRRTLSGHGSWVRGADFSRSGHYVVTSSEDYTARVWNAASGKQLRLLGKRNNDDEKKGHTNWVMSADFSPGGRHVVTASRDGTARVWEWQRGKTVRVIEEPGEEVLSSATFSPDSAGRFVLTTSSNPHDYTARIWDWRAGGKQALKQAFKVLRGHGGPVNNAAWSTDGRYVVTASGDRTARVWDWRTEKTVSVLTGQAGALRYASFSPDGRYVVTASADGSTRVWDWRAAKAVTQVKLHVDLVNSGLFSPDGSRIVTASDDWSAHVFTCETCGPIATLVRIARARVRRTVTPDELRALVGTPAKP